MLTGLKVLCMPCKYVFYRPEHDSKGGDPMKLNFEGLEMQNWNIPMDKVQKVGGKNGFICLVVIFLLLQLQSLKCQK